MPLTLNRYDEDRHITGHIHMDRAGTIRSRILVLPRNRDTFEQFRAEQYPLFRRGYWLYGFDIEATDSEKAEWVRGFTKEEIET